MRIEPLALLAVAANAMAVAYRFGPSGHPALWLDETFTGAIAAQPTLALTVDQILKDVNAPLYYLIAHGWSSVFGLSNPALRFPAMVFSLAAPLLCLMPARGLARRTRWLWCVMLALWFPGLAFSHEARGYSLVYCLAIGGTVAFIRLLDAPRMRQAFVWTALGAIAMLTHYYAVFWLAPQGLALLAVHRTRIARLWPSLLVFGPVVGWLSIHYETIQAFAKPGVAWYPILDVSLLPEIVYYGLGAAGITRLLLGIACVAAAGLLVRGARPIEPVPGSDSQANAYIAASASLAGAMIVIAIAFWRPAFALRYMTFFIPGLMLMIALAAETARRSVSVTPILVALTFLITVGKVMVFEKPKSNAYNFQIASDILMTEKIKTLAFFWDHPANPVESASQLAIVGDFFFKRKGVDVRVIPVKLSGDEDPNQSLLDVLREQPRPAILWLYDIDVHDTKARRFPPRIPQIDPRWRCRDTGADNIGVVVCIPKEAS